MSEQTYPCSCGQNHLVGDKHREALIKDSTDASWGIFQLNDCDWWIARSMAEAKESAAVFYGCEPTDDGVFQDDAHQLSDADLDRLKFLTTESRKGPSISFREELQNRIAAGPKAEMFASTEF